MTLHVLHKKIKPLYPALHIELRKLINSVMAGDLPVDIVDELRGCINDLNNIIRKIEETQFKPRMSPIPESLNGPTNN